MILTINCGSSSLKYQLFDADLERVVAKGLVSRIGGAVGRIDHTAGAERSGDDLPIPDHHAAFAAVIERIERSIGRDGVAGVTGVGHRVVHGGDAFSTSVVIDEAVIERIESFVPLAPLHNPANLTGIREARRVFPAATHVAVFDTAFHQTMPQAAHVYPLPWYLYEEHAVRRYGFHGTSCRFVAARAAEFLRRPLDTLKLVVCHLGNGVTIDAVDRGRSIDTSLGFGTLSGVMMGTRSGDFDPLLVVHLVRALGLTIDEVDRMIHKESGLAGIGGVGNDMREVIAGMTAGDPRCRLAFEMFCYMVRKYVGAYAAAMEGIDGLVFTAGIGENCVEVRAEVCRRLGFLGIRLDETANAGLRGRTGSIGLPGAATAALVVPTDEERMIAIDTRDLMNPHEKDRSA
jgi:acetate kinase